MTGHQCEVVWFCIIPGDVREGTTYTGLLWSLYQSAAHVGLHIDRGTNINPLQPDILGYVREVTMYTNHLWCLYQSAAHAGCHTDIGTNINPFPPDLNEFYLQKL